MEAVSQPKNGLSEKALLFIGLFFLVLFFIIGIVIYRSGKKSGGQTLNLSNVPKDKGTGGEQSAETDINVLAEALHTDMDGTNTFGHNMSEWSRALTLSDTDFARLYNAFNSKYQLESGETLTKWLENESGFWNTSIGWTTTKETFLKRLAKLNLK